MNKYMLSIPVFSMLLGLSAAHAAERGDVVMEARYNPAPGHQVAERDCYGPAVGVETTSVQGEHTDYYSANGEPCPQAEMIFNGDHSASQRGTPPGIRLAFWDGSQNPEVAAPRHKTTSPDDMPPARTPEDFALSGMLPRQQQQPAQNNGLALEGTIERWQTLNHISAGVQDWEKMLDMPLGEVLKTHQQTINELSTEIASTKADKEAIARTKAALEAEKEALAAQKKELASKLRQAEVQAQERQAALDQKIQELQTRLEDRARQDRYETEAEKRKQDDLRRRILDMKQELQRVQQQAGQTERSLMLAAAEKVAEAGRLAYAARLSEQKRLQLQADQKAMESNHLRQRANLMGQANGITSSIRTLPVQAQQPHNVSRQAPRLQDMPVAINVKDMPLQELMKTILTEAVGSWDVDWQLTPGHENLREEKWSLTAEATAGEVMAHVARKVEATHGIQLDFTPFYRLNTLVVTDSISSAQAQ